MQDIEQLRLSPKEEKHTLPFSSTDGGLFGRDTALSGRDDKHILDISQEFVIGLMHDVNSRLGVNFGDLDISSVIRVEDHGGEVRLKTEDDDSLKEDTKRSQPSKNEHGHVYLVCEACGHIVLAVANTIRTALLELKESDAQGVRPLLTRKKHGGILGFKELASRANLSPWHFHRVFRSVTGVTPKAYGEALWDHLLNEYGLDDASSASSSSASYSVGLATSSKSESIGGSHSTVGTSASPLSSQNGGPDYNSLPNTNTLKPPVSFGPGSNSLYSPSDSYASPSEDISELGSREMLLGHGLNSSNLGKVMQNSNYSASETPIHTGLSHQRLQRQQSPQAQAQSQHSAQHQEQAQAQHQGHQQPQQTPASPNVGPSLSGPSRVRKSTMQRHRSRSRGQVAVTHNNPGLTSLSNIDAVFEERGRSRRTRSFSEEKRSRSRTNQRYRQQPSLPPSAELQGRGHQRPGHMHSLSQTEPINSGYPGNQFVDFSNYGTESGNQGSVYMSSPGALHGEGPGFHMTPHVGNSGPNVEIKINAGQMSQYTGPSVQHNRNYTDGASSSHHSQVEMPDLHSLSLLHNYDGSQHFNGSNMLSPTSPAIQSNPHQIGQRQQLQQHQSHLTQPQASKLEHQQQAHEVSPPEDEFSDLVDPDAWLSMNLINGESAPVAQSDLRPPEVPSAEPDMNAFGPNISLEDQIDLPDTPSKMFLDFEAGFTHFEYPPSPRMGFPECIDEPHRGGILDED